jgi:glutaredoxin 3
MSRITIYTAVLCGYCARAKRLLTDKGLDFEEIDVTLDPSRRDEMSRRAGGRRTVPQIFIGDVHVGGSDDLYMLERKGELDDLLAA